VRLDEFKEGNEPPKEISKVSPNKKELDAATYELHKAYLLVDTLLRNMPEK
jgi:hypothetical protein